MQLDAPVHLAVRLGIVGGQRVALAVALRAQAGSGNAVASEVFDYRLRPALRELLVRFGRAHIVGVARNFNLYVAVLLQKFDEAVQLGARLRLECVLVGIEK